MKSAGRLKRFFHVIDLVQNHPLPTRDLIMERLAEEDAEISKKTFERLLAELRDEFFIDIRFNRQKKAYEIEEDEFDHANQLVGFFKLSVQADTLAENLGQSREVSNYVSYDFEEIIKGTEFIAPILEAIRERSVLKIRHKGFQSEESKERLIEPYLLKEFKGRWYLMGYVPAEKMYRSFGFDRIISLEKMSKKFKSRIMNPKEFYQDIIGVSGWELDLQIIKLECSKLQGQYLKALPIHESQKILKETEDKVVIELSLRPNFEFYQQLLSLGSEVKVLSPKTVQKYHKERLQEALRNYNS